MNLYKAKLNIKSSDSALVDFYVSAESYAEAEKKISLRLKRFVRIWQIDLISHDLIM